MPHSLLPLLPPPPPSGACRITYPKADLMVLADNLIATIQNLPPEVEFVKDNPAILDLAVASNPLTVHPEAPHSVVLLVSPPMAVLLMMTIPRLASDGDHHPDTLNPSPDTLSPSPDTLSPSPDTLSPSPDTLSLSPDTPPLPPRRRQTITHHGDQLP